MNSGGTANGNNISTGPQVSADGTVVVFYSSASDLHPLDTDSTPDVFVRDLSTGTTTLVSVNSGGTASGTGSSFGPQVSADGTVVVFYSEASDLDPLDTDTGRDVFARDLSTGTTTLVSVNSSGTASGNGRSYRPRVSADGTVVVFQSTADDLDPLDTDSSADVFARDLSTGTTTLVSVNSGGTASGTGASSYPEVSADGTVVVFQSTASDLDPLDTDTDEDVFTATLSSSSDPCDGAVASLGCQVDGVQNQPCEADDSGQTIIGTNGNDVILGGAGNDTLRGQAGDDLLCGGAGDDALLGGGGNDILQGTSGVDRLLGQAGDDELFGGAEDDTLLGGGGADLLQGEAGNDLLKGQSGDDVLSGGDDDDKLFGGGGNDELDGNTGTDTLIGGPGTQDACGNGVPTGCEEPLP